MKRLVVFGALGVTGIAASCGGDGGPFRRDRRAADAGEGGAPSEGGEGGEPGGEATGGKAGTGAGAAGGGGADGGAGTGEAGAGSGMGAVAGAAGTDSAGVGGVAGTGGVICGDLDCSRLPHVRVGAPVECRNGSCVIPPDSCEEDYGRCMTNASAGCETDLTTTSNCGACRTSCTNANVPAVCMAGQCVATGPCELPFSNCDDRFDCETRINTPDNCGSCGRNDCGATHAFPDCSSRSGCTHPVCEVGYGNCDRTTLDCEATFGASCFPRYLGTRRLALAPHALAAGADGSFVLAGAWVGEIDFDTSPGTDRLTTIDFDDAYLTRFDADGNYAWTRAVAAGPSFEVARLVEVDADGSLIVVGDYEGTTDLDPGPGVDAHVAGPAGDMFVSKLSPSGALTWPRVISGEVNLTDVAVDAAGAVYVTSGFEGEIDLDPGAGTDLHEADGSAAFLLKLDASGNFVWSRLVSGSPYQIFNGVSVAADGSVWCVGKYEGLGSSVEGRPLTGEVGMFIAAFESGGAIRGVWSAEAPSLSFDVMRVVGGAGAVHVSGFFQGELDLDFGSGVASRFTSQYSSGFVTSLDTSGAYRDAHLFAMFPTYPELAAAPDGGVLVGMPTGELHGWYADGSSSFSHKIGQEFGLYMLASKGSHIVAEGIANRTADYDPGPGTDAVAQGTNLVTHYSF